MAPMATATGEITDITPDTPPTPRDRHHRAGEHERAAREGDAPEAPAMTKIEVKLDDPSSGTFTVVLPTAATGGVAKCKVRISLDEA